MHLGVRSEMNDQVNLGIVDAVDATVVGGVVTGEVLEQRVERVCPRVRALVDAENPMPVGLQTQRKVRADLESDLAAYDIQDKPTLQGFYSVLQAVAMLDGRYDEAMAYVEKTRAIELKESKKLMTGQVLAAYHASLHSPSVSFTILLSS